MIRDYALADRLTLQCHLVRGSHVVDASSLPIGPLVELLTFRRSSLDEQTALRIRPDRPGFRSRRNSLSTSSTLDYSIDDTVGVLSIRPGYSKDDDLPLQQFLLDIRKRLGAPGVPQASAQALTGAVGELLDNLDEHAGTQWEALAAYDISSNGFWFAVGDSGQGVLATFKSSQDISSSAQALCAAVIEHRSSTGNHARGLGFRKVLDALRSMDAMLRVRSGDASLESEGQGGSGKWISREQVHLRGFVVSVHVKWNI